MRVPNFIFALLFISLSMASCTGVRYNVLNSIGEQESSIAEIKGKLPVIQSGQELCISVNALNEESAQYFRTSRWKEGATGVDCLYYMVDPNGDANFPIVGKIKLAGFTLEEAEVKVAEALDHLLRGTSVRIRFVNYTVSVLGEVDVPGLYAFEDGRVTILQAIARAGGFEQFGKRDNVLIIRETSTGLKHIRIDLTTDEVWASDYYYLNNNDVVVIDSNPARVANSHNISTYSSLLVGLGTIAAIIAIR